MSFKFSNKINSDFFTKDFTPNSIYLLGLLWADGYIHSKSNSISLECVKEDIDYFYPIFLTTGEYNLSYRKREGRREQGLINCSSLELSSFLKTNDYLFKSTTTPSKILSIIPKNLHSYFYLGWSDGDGCFYYNDKKTLIQFIISGSYDQDWNCLGLLCNSLDINYRIDKFITNKKHKYSRFLINKNEDILRFGNFIYNDLSLGLPRKLHKFKDIKNYINERKSILYSCFDRDGNLIKEFNTLKSASDWINRGRYVGGSINDCIIGRQPTAYGFTWQKSNTYNLIV